MKQLLLIVLLILGFACQKPNLQARNQTVNAPSSVELKIDGQLKAYDRIIATKTTQNGQGFYTFIADRPYYTDNYFSIIVKVDSLKPGIYEIKRNNLCTFKESDTTATNAYDQGIQLNVISNEAGKVKAIFRGTLWNMNQNRVSTVVEGKLSSVQLQYP